MIRGYVVRSCVETSRRCCRGVSRLSCDRGERMAEWISRFTARPPYGIGGLFVLLLYAVQSEIRFGARARAHRTGASDRRSTLAVSVAAVPVLGFALSMKAISPGTSQRVSDWFPPAALPGLPLVAWIGIALGAVGLCIRLWSVLTRRERYTRTLLVQDQHSIERGGPYRGVRHPGYLGSLLCLNGLALASGNIVTLAASLVATSAAYAYRIKVEDQMLVQSLGSPYAEYQGQVGALIPVLRLADRARHSRAG